MLGMLGRQGAGERLRSRRFRRRGIPSSTLNAINAPAIDCSSDQSKAFLRPLGTYTEKRVLTGSRGSHNAAKDVKATQRFIVRAGRESFPLAQDLRATTHELKLNLVTVLPGSFGGLGFTKNTPSIDTLEALMLNAFRMGCPDANLPYVDVRDVASAHVLAMEKDAQGRFIALNDELPTFRRPFGVGIDTGSPDLEPVMARSTPPMPGERPR